jgi:caspase Dronc
MDDLDRKLITENIEQLMDLTNYNRLMQKCREKRMLSDVMHREIEKTPDPNERHRKLFEKITRRGPTAFDTLLTILSEEDWNEAYKLLKPSYAGTWTSVKTRKVSIECNNNNHGEVSSIVDRDELDCSITIGLEPFNGTLEHLEQRIEVQKAETFGKHHKLPVYSMRSAQRGVFFLVNIIDFNGDYDGKLRRNGAEKDRDNLIGLFQGIGGFTIFYYENITQEVSENQSWLFENQF